jgi:hypothetical protein
MICACSFFFRRVGIEMPTIEVRFERLVAEAEVRVGDSGLPTVLNSITNMLEVRTIFVPAPVRVWACLWWKTETDLVRLCFTTAGGGERAAHTPQQEADHAHPPRRQRHHRATKVKRFPCPFLHITEKICDAPPARGLHLETLTRVSWRPSLLPPHALFVRAG